MNTKVTNGSRAKGVQAEGSRGSGLITPWALIMMAVLMVFSFQNIIDNYYGLGLSAAPAFIAAVVIYLVPFSFMIAEFATLKSAKNSSSGMLKWVEAGWGKRAAFLTVFMFWFANLTYFISAVPSRINYLSFAFTGQNLTHESWYVTLAPFLAILLWFIVTWISTMDVKKMARITTVGGTVMLAMTFTFFIIAIFAYMAGGWGSLGEDITKVSGAQTPNGQVIDGSLLDSINNKGIIIDIKVDGVVNHYYFYPEAPGLLPDASLSNNWGDSGGMNFVWFSTFVWVLMAADGAQGMGVYVNKVEGGQKGFSRALIIAVMLIGSIYVVGTLLAAVFPAASLGDNTFLVLGMALYWVIGHMIQLFGGDAAAAKDGIFLASNIIVGWILLISSIGGLLMWTAAPVRTFFTEIPSGVFGSKVTKNNRKGAPVLGAWIQFIIVVPLILIPFISKDGSTFSDIYGLIKTAAGSIGMIPPLFLFSAYFMMRFKNEDTAERSFKMGPRWFGLVVSAFVFVIFVWIFVMATIPLNGQGQWTSDTTIAVIMEGVMLLFIALPVWLWYERYEKKMKETKIANMYGIDETSVLIKYSLTNKFISLFNDEIRAKREKQLAELDKAFDKKYKEASAIHTKAMDAYEKDIAAGKESEKPQSLKQIFKSIDEEYKLEIKSVNNSIKAEEAKLIAELKERSATDMKKIAGYKEQFKAEKAAFKKEVADIKAEIKSLKATINESNEEEVKSKISEFASRQHQVENEFAAKGVDFKTEVNLLLEEVELPADEDVIFDSYALRSAGNANTSLSDRVIVSKEKLYTIYQDSDDLRVDILPIDKVKVLPMHKSIEVMINGEKHLLQEVQFMSHDGNNISTTEYYVPQNSKILV